MKAKGNFGPFPPGPFPNDGKGIELVCIFLVIIRLTPCFELDKLYFFLLLTKFSLFSFEFCSKLRIMKYVLLDIVNEYIMLYFEAIIYIQF